MAELNPHVGSTFESWLDETGLRDEITSSAIKSVIAHQIADAMATEGLTKVLMAERMQTSRAQLDRLLDPQNTGVTLETLQKAARVVGRELNISLATRRDAALAILDRVPDVEPDPEDRIL